MIELTKFQQEFIDKNYFKCPYCDFEIFVCDVITLNKLMGHSSECIINKEVIIQYEKELFEAKQNRDTIHEKYRNLIKL